MYQTSWSQHKYFYFNIKCRPAVTTAYVRLHCTHCKDTCLTKVTIWSGRINMIDIYYGATVELKVNLRWCGSDRILHDVAISAILEVHQCSGNVNTSLSLCG